MNVLIPLTITDAMLTSSTVPEPAAGETAWVSAGTYVVGDLCIRSTTHRVYRCVQGHTGRTALPEVDVTFWLDVSATLRWSIFDQFVSTPSTGTTSISYVLRPGFFNAVALLGLVGDTLTLSLKDAPGGTVVYNSTNSLVNDPLDWYDWAFGVITQKSMVVVPDLLPYADPELTVTVTGVGTVKAGMLVVGDYRPLMSPLAGYGVQYGATVQPTTFSYIKTDEFGNTVIKQRGSATDMSVDLVLPTSDASSTLTSVKQVLDVPALWVATASPLYDGLTVFGLGSGRLTYDSLYTNFAITVKGML